jgi:SulP family sulfate permease
MGSIHPLLCDNSRYVTSDLLSGLAIGLFFGITYTLYTSYKNSHQTKTILEENEDFETHHIVLAEEVSFLNKVSILRTLKKIPTRSKVIIDYSKNKSITYDVKEILIDFEETAVEKNITIEILKEYK